LLATWADVEDLVNIGAYAAGTSVEFDLAVEFKPRIDELLRQGIQDRAPYEDSCAALMDLHGGIAARRAQLARNAQATARRRAG